MLVQEGRIADGGFGPQRNIFSPPSQQHGTAKFFTTVREDLLSDAEGLGLGLKGLFCKSTNNYTSGKDTNTRNTAGPRSGPPGSFHPPVSSALQAEASLEYA